MIFGPKVEEFDENCHKVKNLIAHKIKKVGQTVKKQQDNSNFRIENRDCPAKNGTVGEYGNEDQYIPAT